MHPSFRLHEICCRFVYTLPAHTDRVHGKNPSPHLGILFAPICFFEILPACFVHDASEIDRSTNRLFGGLNLEANFGVSP